MILNILSDVHLSQGSLKVPATAADLVVLAGDIGRPEAAVSWASKFDRTVLYVPGNHEFYGGTIEGTVKELRQLCAGTNIRVLANDETMIGGVRFLGTTLWTDFMLFGGGEKRAGAIAQAVTSMRDFSRIRMTEDSEGPFTPADSAALFTVQAAWLQSKLAQPFSGKTVVITHHSPSLKSIHPRFAGSLLNACFVSNAEYLVDGARAHIWIHGHTHDSFDYLLNGTRVVCNPRGYQMNGTNENPLFDPYFALDVPAAHDPA